MKAESADDRVSDVKGTKACPHLDKSIDLDKISGKIGSSNPVRCEDCREVVGDRKGKKGKGKHGKKMRSASADAKSDFKAIWVCLDCGHYACGGVALPATPQSHMVWHARQTHHHLVIQWENPLLCWCFPCNVLIPVEKTEENSENKDILSEVVKLIKWQSAEGTSVDVVKIWFVGGSATSEIKSESTVLSWGDLDGNACYVVKGLDNLGNTCFFNSVVQNLLAMSRLRDYFLNVDVSFGPLTIALKKLFTETKTESGLRNVIDPRSFFGCVCSEAPQFKGHQQQDSHELLRCLHDRLCSEELGFRKRNSTSEESGISSNHCPTFVDSIFGGQISSTVHYLDCRHSSTVYEPFLDLSLPLPTKKALSKKAQPTSQAKKMKLLPKESGRIQSKGNKDTDTVTAQSISNLSASSKTQSLTKSTAPLSENVVSTSGGSQLSDLVGSTTMATLSGSALQNFPADPLPEHDQVLDNPVEQTVASGEKDKVLDDSLINTDQIPSLDSKPNPKPDSFSGDDGEDKLPLVVQDSEVTLLPYNKENSSTAEKISGEAEASSNVVGCGLEEVDFYGFRDLLNEPDIAIGPVAGPSLGTESVESGFAIGNSSDSDPDQVDDLNSPVSVEGCLARFLKPELLTNDNALDCESCSKTTDQTEGSCSVDGATSSGYTTDKVHQSDSQFGAGNRESEESKVKEIDSKNVRVKSDAIKRVLINKAPTILTIHLKRFNQDDHGRLSKLNGHVNFSEIINLRPYMDPRCIGHENFDYHLVGVVEHLGTMRGGHYVACVRGSPKNRVKAEKENVWYRTSDVHVREVSLKEVLRSEAYILFYEKKLR